jgi:deazaflavin-dependent oxidoreductase (nitroreductase family)
MSHNATTVPTGTPPAWVNSMMAAMLRTPGLERLIGKGIALITVTGRKTRTRYTTPVSYYQDENTVLVITKTFRIWWRNLYANPEVELRFAGRQHRGRARVMVDDPASLPHLRAFSEHRRRDARLFGLTFTPDGRLDESQARSVLPYLVILEITLATGESSG